MSAKSAKASKAVKRRDPMKKHHLNIVEPEVFQARRENIAAVLVDVDAYINDETTLPVFKELAEPVLAMACSFFRPLAKGEERATLDELGSALMFRFVDRHLRGMTDAGTLPRAKRKVLKRAPSKKKKPKKRWKR